MGYLKNGAKSDETFLEMFIRLRNQKVQLTEF